MQGTILEELYFSFSDHRFIDRGIKPTMDIFVLADFAPDIYEKLGDDRDKMTERIEDAVTDLCCMNERNGFLSGVKLGMQLAEEIFGKSEINEK